MNAIEAIEEDANTHFTKPKPGSEFLSERVQAVIDDFAGRLV